MGVICKLLGPPICHRTRTNCVSGGNGQYCGFIIHIYVYKCWPARLHEMRPTEPLKGRYVRWYRGERSRRNDPFLWDSNPTKQFSVETCLYGFTGTWEWFHCMLVESAQLAHTNGCRALILTHICSLPFLLPESRHALTHLTPSWAMRLAPTARTPA